MTALSVPSHSRRAIEESAIGVARMRCTLQITAIRLLRLDSELN
jgi:hypothetical protein